MNPNESRKCGRSSWHRLLALGTCAILLVCYVGSYVWLSRVGIKEAAAYNMPGFLYVPIDEVMISHDLTMHDRLTYFYAPLNAIDQKLFGAPGPIKCIMFEID